MGLGNIWQENIYIYNYTRPSLEAGKVPKLGHESSQQPITVFVFNMGMKPCHVNMGVHRTYMYMEYCDVIHHRVDVCVHMPHTLHIPNNFFNMSININ